MSALHLVKPDPDKQPLTLEELLALLGPHQLNAIDAKAKIMRETFQCPYTVRDYEEFKDVIARFFFHYHKAFFNADYTKLQDQETPRNMAYEFARQHLGGFHGGLFAAERNAKAGRDGGMIAIIDILTDEITKLHTENYIRAVFFEHIPSSDLEMRHRLAKELLSKYGPVLFPGEQLLPDFLLVANLEEFIRGFVNHIHALRREWRY